MTGKIPEDAAFTITTGYYPEIASGIKYKKGHGKGGTGKKYLSKSGYSDSSVAIGKAKGMTDLEKMINAGTETPMFKAASYTEKDTGISKKYWKFTGGSEKYKLYGDQVWYMHGKREKNALSEYVEGRGENSPKFSNIYSQMEPRLAAEAISLASDIFDMAVDEVEKSLEAEKGTDSAEEVGFKDGDFEYLSHEAALAKYPQLSGGLKKQSMSAANPRDLVIIKDGQIVGTRDVSEMPIDKLGQHGIVDIPKELSDAIKAVKENGGEDMGKLKQGVIKMFTSAITKNYNPVIKKLKLAAGFADFGKSGKNMKGDWNAVLKNLSSSGKKVNTIQMGDILAQQMVKVGLLDSNEKSATQTSIEYVAHMLGTLNLETNENFKQSHLIHEMPDGQGVYANVPMVTDPKTLLFKTEPVNKTEIVTGFNATLAERARGNWGLLGSAKEASKTQKWAYAMNKVTGMTSSKSGLGSAVANMGISKTARPATVVTIPATDKLEEKLLKDIQEGMNIPDLKKRLGHGNKNTLQQRKFGLGKRRRKMKKGEDSSKTQFWALPYIGVLSSEHYEK